MSALERRTPVPVIVLAAGGSSRLGRPKQLVTYEGRPLLARAIAAALGSGASPVFVVLGAFHREIAAATPALVGCHAVLNEDWRSGLGGSLRAGMLAMLRHTPEAPAALVMLCDQPAVSAGHLKALLALHGRDPERIAASFYAGRPGIPALFPRRCFPALQSVEGDTGARMLLRSAEENPALVPLADGERDVDTEEDLAAEDSAGL